MKFPTAYAVRSTEINFLPVHMRPSRSPRLYIRADTAETFSSHVNITGSGHESPRSKTTRWRVQMLSMENVTRHDNEDDDNEEPYAEITAAVEKQMDEKIKQIEAKTALTIKEAVKRAVDKQVGHKNASSSKKLKKYAAKSKLQAGKAIIAKQQKLIRIADREENSREVVKHYMSDELASDSEGEKAISKARKEALASIKNSKRIYIGIYRKSKLLKVKK